MSAKVGSLCAFKMRKGVNQRRIQSAQRIYIIRRSDISNDLKWRPKGRAILNLHWYKSSLV